MAIGKGIWDGVEEKGRKSVWDRGEGQDVEGGGGVGGAVQEAGEEAGLHAGTSITMLLHQIAARWGAKEGKGSKRAGRGSRAIWVVRRCGGVVGFWEGRRKCARAVWRWGEEGLGGTVWWGGPSQD